MVFKNRVLKVIFCPYREKVRESWRELHNVELHDLCSSLNINRFVKSNQGRRGGWGTWHKRREEKCIHGFDGET